LMTLAMEYDKNQKMGENGNFLKGMNQETVRMHQVSRRNSPKREAAVGWFEGRTITRSKICTYCAVCKPRVYRLTSHV